jgi:PIN domain nuclease of toxin-antitoxin system
MAYLLDSHIIVWQLEDPGKFSPTVARLLDSDHPGLFVSPVTAYELRYKSARGRLPTLPESLAALAAAAGYDELPITIAAAEIAARFPLEHRDPWDRLLAGQAIAHGYAIVTTDPEIKKLGVQTIW